MFGLHRVHADGALFTFVKNGKLHGRCFTCVSGRGPMQDFKSHPDIALADGKIEVVLGTVAATNAHPGFGELTRCWAQRRPKMQAWDLKN